MAGRRFFDRGAFTHWLAAGLAMLLAGCAAPPDLRDARPDAVPVAAAAPAEPADVAMPATAPAAPAPAIAPQPAVLADFIGRHLRKPVEPVVPAAGTEIKAETPTTSGAAVDDKYRLTGEAARELERGRASWYGGQFHGRRTASGENYDKYALTAAHKTLPFGTIVRVRSLVLGREVDVRINDRGPFTPGRVIDVSQAAAEALGLMGAGVAEVSLKVDDTLKDAPQQVSRSRSKAPRRAPARPAEAYRH